MRDYHHLASSIAQRRPCALYNTAENRRSKTRRQYVKRALPLEIISLMFIAGHVWRTYAASIAIAIEHILKLARRPTPAMLSRPSASLRQMKRYRYFVNQDASHTARCFGVTACYQPSAISHETYTKLMKLRESWRDASAASVAFAIISPMGAIAPLPRRRHCRRGPIGIKRHGHDGESRRH